MKLFLCVHSHRHGHTHYLAWSNRELTMEDFIKRFDIDFEEDREDEHLEVGEYGENIPTIE